MTDVVLVWTRLDLARLTVYTRVHIFWYWAIVIRSIFTVIRRLWTGATIIGARRSKGHTNPANLANLAEREENRSRSLCLSNVELSKITDENEMPVYFTFFKLLCWPRFFPRIQSKLWLVLSPLRNTTSSSQDLSSLPPRETLGTRLVRVMLQIAISLSWSC